MWLILILLVVVLLAYLDTRKPKSFPPGPAWFPLIGCAWQLHKLHRSQGNLTKASQALAAEYGPLVGVRFGHERAVLVCGLRAIEEMFTRDELNGRPTALLAVNRAVFTGNGIVFNDSESFQEQKRFVQKHLKESGYRKEILMDIVQREARAIVNNIKRKINHDDAITSDSLFGEQLLESLWVLMAGNQSHLDDLVASGLLRLLHELSSSILFSGAAVISFPFLKYICPEYSGYNTYIRLHKTIFELMSKLVHGVKITSNPNPSLVRAYLETIDSVGKSSFNNDQLLAICADLFVGGFEMTYSTLSFALFYIVTHPDLQKKAQDEIDRVVGRERLPTLEDKPQLPYVQSVALESLRMAAGRSFLVPRRATMDTTFNGYFIPKDTVLIGNQRGTFMDPNIGWTNPSVFNPDRFMKDGCLNVPDGFIPFGLGKRRCPGVVLAKANLFVIIACLLHTFNFKPVPGNSPRFEVNEGFIAAMKPFKLIVSLR